MNTLFSKTSVTGTVWAIDSNNLAIQYFRVTSVTSGGDGTFTIAGVQQDPNKYAYIDDGVCIDSAPITVISTSVMSAPGNITITEARFVEQGLSVSAMQVAWDKSAGAINYTVQWRKDNGDWINVSQTSAQGFTIQGIYSGGYDVRVRAVNTAGVSSPWDYAEFSNATVRGALYASSGEMNNVVIHEDCTIEGTLEANKIEGELIRGGAFTFTLNRATSKTIMFSGNRLFAMDIWIMGAYSPIVKSGTSKYVKITSTGLSLNLPCNRTVAAS